MDHEWPYRSQNAVFAIGEEIPGDFPYFYNQAVARECLGADWSEQVELQVAPGWRSAGIRFSRLGWPDVIVFEDVTRGEVTVQSRSQLIILGATQ